MNTVLIRVFLWVTQVPLEAPPPTTDATQQAEITQAVEDTKALLDRIPGLNFDALGPFGRLIFYVIGLIFTVAAIFGFLSIAYGFGQFAWPGNNATRVSNGKKNMGKGGFVVVGVLFFGAIALWLLNIVQNGTTS